MNAASKKAFIPRIDSVNYIGFTVKVPRQIGPGSWYGKQFHNRKTASGQLFDMYGYTAAHRTLPFGFTSNHQPMIIPLYACTNLEVFKDFSDAIKRQQERQNIESKSGAESVIMIVPDITSKKSRMPKFTFLVSSITSELAFGVLPAHE